MFCGQYLLLILLLPSFSTSQQQSRDQLELNDDPNEPQSVPCYSATTCSECISLPISNCSWCSDTGYNDQLYSRCESSDKILINNKCNPINIINPVGTVEIVRDAKNEAKEDLPINLYPKKVKLNLRPGQPLRFNLTLKQEENYPLDLYYLMDLTYSMKDHKDSLGTLADQLSVEMLNITSNFRLGFGSFIDKITMPFASKVPRKLINPCSDGVDCVAPYSFRNHLSLTDQFDEFTAEVKSAGLSGNLDNAEGGLDAIVQSIVCKDEIKWDAKDGVGDKGSQIRRKILLFATGSEFHFAGDGKLGGVVARNDLKCHLDTDGYYDYSLQQDYPSVYQVNKVINANKVNLIFAVTPDAVNIYTQLSSMIDGSVVGILSDDSSNIVSLIRKNYDKIVSKVELISNVNDEKILINFFSKCKNSNENSLKKTNLCENIKIGDEINFEVEILINECSPELINKIIKISPIGLSVETEVEISVNCNCNCEAINKSSPKDVPSSRPPSKECNYKGHLDCGICACSGSSFGKNCECDGTSSKVSNEKFNECRRPLSEVSDYSDASSLVSKVSKLSPSECSNRGVCNCGICTCDTASLKGELFYGKYCECDTFSCESSLINGKVCGGHGKCCDGLCTCDDGWSGSSCDCIDDDKSCVGPNGKICSGHGRCECGSCVCGKSSGKERFQNGSNIESSEGINDGKSSLFYVGTFCEECLNCDGRCSDIEECIKCSFDTIDTILDEEACEIACLKFDIHFVVDANDTTNLIDVDANSDSRKLINQLPETIEIMKKCKLTDENGCYIDFYYEFNYESERADVYVTMDTKSCPDNINIWIIIGSIIALIVLIGLILICTIRFLVYLKDRSDFLKWQEEVEAAKKDLGSKNTNPLYREANTKYNNPLYGN